MNPDVVVIGAGIVGCSCAYYLAKAGVRVMLVDKEEIGSGSSKAGMTQIATWEGPEINIQLSLASIRLYKALREELPFDTEIRENGCLVVMETPEDTKAFLTEVEHLRSWGVNCEVLSNKELLESEPILSPHVAGGVIFPEDMQVNPLLITQALALGAERLGAVVLPFTEVKAIELSPNGRAVSAVITDKGLIPTGQVVIASGAWSGLIGKMIGLEIPISPRKGTLVLTEAVPENIIRHKCIVAAGYLGSISESTSKKLVGSPVIHQSKNGNLLIGSSRQFLGFEKSVDPLVVATMISRCLRIMPGLGKISAIRTWSGLRPYSADLLPIISPVEEISGVYIAAGHEGMGITEGPISGKLITQLILGKETEFSLDKVAFSRFQSEVKEIVRSSAL